MSELANIPMPCMEKTTITSFPRVCVIDDDGDVLLVMLLLLWCSLAVVKDDDAC